LTCGSEERRTASVVAAYHAREFICILPNSRNTAATRNADCAMMAALFEIVNAMSIGYYRAQHACIAESQP
jgi:hypothetical protein